MPLKGVVRRIDELGRLVIPIEIRRVLGLKANEPVEIKVEGGRVIIEKYKDCCLICGSTEDMQSVNEKMICKSCVDKIKDL